MLNTSHDRTPGNGLGASEVSTCECNDGQFYTLSNTGCCPYPIHSTCPSPPEAGGGGDVREID